LLRRSPVPTTRPARIRGLRFYDAAGDNQTPLGQTPLGQTPLGAPVGARPWPASAAPAPAEDERPRVHARSWFRSVGDPHRLALYSVRDAPLRGPLDPAPPAWGGEHTLRVVREFRRVPLGVSTLALALFTARAGRVAALVAALAHYVERAVSVYQPTYVLLAHSLQAPRINALLLGVQDSAALEAASPAAFSVDLLLPEIAPLLALDPDWYVHAPERERLLTSV
jgi:hypothetical protein